MLIWQARFDEAERELKLAQLLDPLYPFNYVALGKLLRGSRRLSKGFGAMPQGGGDRSQLLARLQLLSRLRVTTGWEITARR